MQLLNFSWAPMVVGGLFLTLTGLLQRLHAISNPNNLLGYRTPRSLSTPDSWRFAQRYAGSRSIFAGLVLLVLAPCVGLMPSGWLITGFIGSGLVVFAGCFILITTEIALSRRHKS